MPSKRASDAPEPKAEPKAKSAPKVPAGESSDPAVHQLLAHLQTAIMNGDDEAIDAIKEQLAEMGYA